jgi:copper chaperone CopZ
VRKLIPVTIVLLSLSILPLAGASAEADKSGAVQEVKEVVFKIEGMKDAESVEKIQKTVMSIDGVTRCDIDLDNGTATIQYKGDKTSCCNVRVAIDKIGYKADHAGGDENEQQQGETGKPKCCSAKKEGKCTSKCTDKHEQTEGKGKK